MRTTIMLPLMEQSDQSLDSLSQILIRMFYNLICSGLTCKGNFTIGPNDHHNGPFRRRRLWSELADH